MKNKQIIVHEKGAYRRIRSFFVLRVIEKERNGGSKILVEYLPSGKYCHLHSLTLPRPTVSLHEFIDGVAQIGDGLFVTGGDSIHHAVAHVILEDHFAGVFQRGTYRRQLYQYF